MKKKVFLISLLIVALICVFAISVFAEELIVSKTESDEYGTVIQLNTDPGLDNAGQYVSILKKINDGGTDKDALCILTDGTYYYVFPSSYIVNETKGGKNDGRFDIYAGTESNPGLAQAMAEFNTAMNTSYYAGYVIEGSGAGKRLNEIVRFEFTSDVIFPHKDYCCMRKYPSLVEVRFNYEIDLSRAANLFQGSSKLTTVVGFENVSVEAIDTSIFNGCTALESVSLPIDITRIPSSMFSGCGKVTIENLAECTQLTTIGSGAFKDTGSLVFALPDTITTIEAGAFQSAFKDGNGGSFTINPTSQLTTIGADAFNDCRKLTSIYIPSSVTSIGTNAFRNNFALERVENFENCQITILEDGTFTSAHALNSLKLPRTVTTVGAAFVDNNNLTLVYIPDSITSIADTFTGGKPTNAVYIYTGTDASVFSTCARLAGASVIPANEYVEENSYTGVNLVVGYSGCIVYNKGVHADAEIDAIVSSYLDEIKVVSICTSCGMADDTGKIPALFKCLGYSAPESGVGGVTIGFTVNNKALAEYEKVAGKIVEYGVFVVSKDKLGDGSVFSEDGTPATGVLSAKINACEFVAFELKIVGFTTDVQKEAKLAMGAYVAVTDGETTEYSYMQSGAPNENEKYCFVSYNDIVGSASTN